MLQLSAEKKTHKSVQTMKKIHKLPSFGLNTLYLSTTDSQESKVMSNTANI